MTNDWKARLGMVYSTNPNFKYDTEEAPQIETLAPRTTGPARLARPQAAGRQDRHARQRFRRLGCRPGGTGPPAQNPLRRGRGSQGRRNHHPGRPPRPGGRNPRQSGLQMQKSRRMTRPAPMRRFAAILFLLGFLFIGGKSVRAQYYSWGADAAALRWKHLRTEDVRVVFPDTASALAHRTLYYIQAVRPTITHGFSHPPLKIPFVLHTENFQSNGLVMWMPKRIEFLTTPSVDSYSMPWVKQLVAHEYRHAVQYNNLNRGVDPHPELPDRAARIDRRTAFHAPLGARRRCGDERNRDVLLRPGPPAALHHRISCPGLRGAPQAQLRQVVLRLLPRFRSRPLPNGLSDGRLRLRPLWGRNLGQDPALRRPQRLHADLQHQRRLAQILRHGRGHPLPGRLRRPEPFLGFAAEGHGFGPYPHAAAGEKTTPPILIPCP